MATRAATASALGGEQPLPERLRDAVAAEVRAAMGRRQVNQTQLAQRLGLSQTAVSRRLHGQIAFDVMELASIASALRIPLAELIKNAEESVIPCYWTVPSLEGQMELALGLEPPALVAL